MILSILLLSLTNRYHRKGCVGVVIDWLVRFCWKSDFCVDETSNDTDVKTDKVHEGVLIVAPYGHAKVGDQDVLQAPDDGGGQGGVIGGAHHSGEDQNEPEHTGHGELDCEPAVTPTIILCKGINEYFLSPCSPLWHSPNTSSMSPVCQANTVAGPSMKRLL